MGGSPLATLENIKEKEHEINQALYKAVNLMHS